MSDPGNHPAWVLYAPETEPPASGDDDWEGRLLDEEVEHYG